MYILLLTLIYIAFVSLGIPDALLGSGWPAMQHDFNVPLYYASILTIIIAGSTILSSLLTDTLTRRLGSFGVVVISVLISAIAMLGFALSSSFYMLVLWSFPYGLGAGAVDAVLNNFVSTHYSNRHMNWLHCCLGVGTSLSPLIMSYALSNSIGWSGGYMIVFVIQIILTVIILFSFPLWRNILKINKLKNEPPPALLPLTPTTTSASNITESSLNTTLIASVSNESISNESKSTENVSTKHTPKHKLTQIIRSKGVIIILLAFFLYCGVESMIGLWISSYLVISHNITIDTAALFGSLFFIGITVGRFFSGLISTHLGNHLMTRLGLLIALFGNILILLPLPSYIILTGLIVMGIGCATIFPSMLHATPTNFKKEHSQSIMSLQMASAYAGNAILPPAFGLIADYINISLLPFVLLVLIILVIILTERLTIIVKRS